MGNDYGKLLCMKDKEMETSQVLLIIGIAVIVLAAGTAGTVVLIRKYKNKEAEEYLNHTVYSQEMAEGSSSDIEEPSEEDTENVWTSDSAYTPKE